jgi:calcium binding protein 39
MNLLGLSGRKQRTPESVALKAKEALSALAVEEEEKPVQRAEEELSKQVHCMKATLCGDSAGKAQRASGGPTTLVEELVLKEVIADFCTKLALVDFEARKDLVTVFGAILRHESSHEKKDSSSEPAFPATEFLRTRPKLLEHLVEEYENADTALNAGAMLREAFRHESLAELVIFSPYFSNFFRYIELPSFEVASDAFTTFKEALTRNKHLASRFLNERHDDFFSSYNRLLRSENYVTRRQSVKLLGELLLDKANHAAMLRYIADVHNLQLVMNLLKDSSRSIEFEAFHIFKVFVANPHKPKEVHHILMKNKDKLLRYLDDFQNDRDDQQFTEEKAAVTRFLGDLQPMESNSTVNNDSSTASTSNGNALE